MQKIYRRWLIQYRWAIPLRGGVLQAYQFYLRMIYRMRKYSASYKLLDGVSQLATATTDKDAPSKTGLLENVTVVGQSLLILKKKEVAYDSTHPDFRFKDIYTAYCFLEESLGLMYYNPRTERCHFASLTLQARLDGTWLSVMSGASTNWMHWMAESIPRLAGVLAEVKNMNFGLLVDQALPKNMREVLDIFAGDIPRFEVRPRHIVEVSQLIVPSQPAGMCLAWPRPSYFNASGSKPDRMVHFRRNGIYHFDASGLKLSRETILEHFDIQPRKVRKLFILRKSYFRHMINQAHIEKLLIERGFELVSPGEMNVEEQVKLFSEVAVVIAQGGAALANIMFMPEGSTVICMAVQNEYTNFGYFLDYAKIFGVSLEYVIGEVDDHGKYNADRIGKADHPMNAEFRCPENELLQVLDRLH